MKSIIAALVKVLGMMGVFLAGAFYSAASLTALIGKTATILLLALLLFGNALTFVVFLITIFVALQLKNKKGDK